MLLIVKRLLNNIDIVSISENMNASVKIVPVAYIPDSLVKAGRVAPLLALLQY